MTKPGIKPRLRLSTLNSPFLWWVSFKGHLSCSVVLDSLWPHRLCSLPGSSVHGIRQERWSVLSHSLLQGIFQLRNLLHCWQILYHLSHQGSQRTLYLLLNTYGGGLVAKSCPTLETPCTLACQAPLSKGILQARILKWVAISISRVKHLSVCVKY